MKAETKLDLEPILSQAYPRVYRLALSLCQNSDAGMAVVKRVLARSGVIFDRWESQEEADRWFLHYTVLCSRHQTTQKDDLLFSVAEDPVWKGIVLAIRHLPMQQREAYLLHHGEGLDLRQLATAMDCSSSAAANHLNSADKALRPIADDRLAGFTAGLPGLMTSLVPPPGTVEVEINRVIRKRQQMIWLRRWVILPLKLGLALVAAWLVWNLWHRIVR